VRRRRSCARGVAVGKPDAESFPVAITVTIAFAISIAIAVAAFTAASAARAAAPAVRDQRGLSGSSGHV